jgi:HlyD family secretion protein
VLAGCKHGKGGGSADEAVSAASASDAPPTTVELASATRGPIETTLAAQGTLTPGQGASARVAAAVAGRVVDVRVREGERVSAGQVLAIVDNRPQQAQFHSAQAALTTSQAQARGAEMAARAAASDQANAARAARLALDAALLDRANAIETAQNALQSAETDLRKTKAGARPQEIAQADQAVNQAKVTRDRAASELDRTKKLLEIGIAAKRQLEDAQSAFDVAESALESARQQASLVRAGARPEDLRAAELRVEGAQKALSQARKTGDAKVAQAQAALRQAEQSVLQVDVKRQDAAAMRETAHQKQADLAAAQATANYAEVRAPLSGLVTRRALNPGDMADTTNPIVEIADSRSLNLLANLPAEEGLQVRMGMPVRVTSTDAQGKTFAGRVLSIGQVDPQTNLLTLRIAVFNAGGILRIGSFATAEIVLRTDPHAVLVPKVAVISHEGKSVVFVVGTDGTAHQKEVTVEAEQGDQVAIAQGVAAGDRVVRLGQYELADGAKVREAGKEDETKDKSAPDAPKSESNKDDNKK